jgi:hypothetical protein
MGKNNNSENQKIPEINLDQKYSKENTQIFAKLMIYVFLQPLNLVIFLYHIMEKTFQ